MRCRRGHWDAPPPQAPRGAERNAQYLRADARMAARLERGSVSLDTCRGCQALLVGHAFAVALQQAIVAAGGLAGDVRAEGAAVGPDAVVTGAPDEGRKVMPATK